MHEWHVENQPTDDEHDRVDVLEARVLHNGRDYQIDGDEQHDHRDHEWHLKTAEFCECDQRETMPGGRSHKVFFVSPKQKSESWRVSKRRDLRRKFLSQTSLKLDTSALDRVIFHFQVLFALT